MLFILMSAIKSADKKRKESAQDALIWTVIAILVISMAMIIYALIMGMPLTY